MEWMKEPWCRYLEALAELGFSARVDFDPKAEPRCVVQLMRGLWWVSAEGDDMADTVGRAMCAWAGE